MSRIESKWKTEKRFHPILIGDDVEACKLIKAYQEKAEIKIESSGFIHNLLQNSKEVILKKDAKGNFVFNFVSFGIDTSTFQIVLSNSLEVSEIGDLEKIKSYLALAIIEEVPIYGDDETIQDELIKLQKDILENGFKTELDGNEVTLKISRFTDLLNSPREKLSKSLCANEFIIPAAIHITNQELSSEIKEYANAHQFLLSVDSMISELGDLLSSSKRNENKLQSFLTEHPLLFGTHYKRIIPKHQLGAEYELDYALERFDSIFDIVEIEASSLKLYNLAADPSSELIHAEQQILNYQQWIEEKSYYARDTLKNVQSPKGYVVIGSRTCLNDITIKKLRTRNIVFRDKIEILTYDDLLDKVKCLRDNIRLGKFQQPGN